MKSFTNVHSRYILFSLLAVFISSCAAKKPQLLGFEYLPAVYEHEYVEHPAKAYLLNDQESYDKLLGELKIKQQGRSDYSDYWENSSLLLVYGGTRPTSGYNIQTDSISYLGKGMKITAIFIEPGENCVVSDMITYPFQLLAIPKTYVKEEIELVLKSRKKPCR